MSTSFSISRRSLQVGILVKFSLVGGAGAVERLPSQRMLLLLLLLLWLVVMVAAVLSWSRTSQSEAAVLLEQRQGRVSSAGPAVAG